MNALQDTITNQFVQYLKSQIIAKKNVFESKVCRSEALSAILVYTNENKYRGDVNQTGEMNGKGRFDWAEGDYYQGDFKADTVNGNGIMVYKNCSKIIGSMRHGLPHGECKLITKSAKYTGHFEYGKKSGDGIFYAVDGNKEKILYSGKWLDDEKYEGTRYYENGTFIGNFQNNQRYNGVYIFNNGETYAGQYANNKYDGYGVYTWPQHNTSYAGYWRNGYKHGFGVIQLNELQIMTFWEDNIKSGSGLIKCCNGDILISPEMFKENILWNANLIATYSTIQLIALLTQPTAAGLYDFINLHYPLALNMSLNVLSPFLTIDSYINIHQTDQIIRFIVSKYDDHGKPANRVSATVIEVLNYEILNLRTFIAKLYQLLVSIYNTHKLNRQINVWHFIMRLNSRNHNQEYSFNLLQMANANFNLLIKNLYDPNEMIAFYQFLKLLVSLAITFYGEDPCANELIGNLSYCFLKLIRTVMIIYDDPDAEAAIDFQQFNALDNEVHFAQYESMKLREFVESAIKKRRILKWAEEELFEAIAAIIPRFLHNGFVIDFRIPIMPLEFYFMYRKLIEIALLRE